MQLILQRNEQACVYSKPPFTSNPQYLGKTSPCPFRFKVCHPYIWHIVEARDSKMLLMVMEQGEKTQVSGEAVARIWEN